MALGSAARRRFLRKPIGQRVGSPAEAGEIIVVAFEVVDPFAGEHDIVRAEGSTTRDGILCRVLFGAHRESAELAQIEAVRERVQILKGLDEFPFAPPGQGIGFEARYDA